MTRSNSMRPLFRTIAGFAIVMVAGTFATVSTERSLGQEANAPRYPLGLELQVVARDLTSKEYHAVLETMIPTDLSSAVGSIFSTTGRNGPTLAIRPGGRGDVTATHVFWQTARGGSHVPSPVYHDGKLFLISDTGIATCLDATHGTPYWQKRLEGRFSMSPVAVGDRLIVTNEPGKTFVLKAAEQYELLAENDLGENTLATPAVLGGRIYFRTAEHLLCVAGD